LGRTAEGPQPAALAHTPGVRGAAATLQRSGAGWIITRRVTAWPLALRGQHRDHGIVAGAARRGHRCPARGRLRRLTQRSAANQATAKEARDREHERQVWARQLRYQTHVQFLAEFWRLHEAASHHHHNLVPSKGEQADTSVMWAEMMWAVDTQLTMLVLLAKPSTYEKARAAFGALMEYAFGRADSKDVHQLLSQYVTAVRAESNLEPLAPPAG
jgi:hypothetical protein